MMKKLKSKWDPNQYDENFSFVYQYGEDLLQMLNPQIGERILDLGCGTGELTDQIHQSGAQIVGMDNSSEMIQSARTKYPQLNFVIGDAEDFLFKSPFHAIFSNATLHWVLNYSACIAAMRRNLHNRGRLVLEFGAKGNISNIITPLRNVLSNRGYKTQADLELWYFPSIGEYTSALESNGFQVKMAQQFDRPTELADDLSDWLQMFASQFFIDIPPSEVENIKLEVQELAKPSCYLNGKWVADYRRIRIFANKMN